MQDGDHRVVEECGNLIEVAPCGDIASAIFARVPILSAAAKSEP